MDSEAGRGWHIERPHPRALLAAMIVGVLMLLVGLFLAAVAVKLLDLSGGAARDTSLVVAVAAFAVSDFWGGGIVTALTRASVRQVTVVWTIARLVLLALIALLASRMLPLLPLQLAIAAAAGWAGSKVAHKQIAMRHEIELEQPTS